MSEEQVVEPVEAERPEGLPEKFKDLAAMADSYAELEKKLSQKAPEGIIKDPAEEAETSEANLDLADFYTEYADAGSLSEDSYKKLQGAGWSQNDVDRFITLETAERGREAEALYAQVDGGAEAYGQALEWAKVDGNVEEDYKSDFNETMNTDNNSMRTLMMKDLMSKWTAAGGEVVTPQGQNVENIQTASGPQKDVFKSQAEITNAMSSPEYKRDQAFRDAVAAKMQRSKF